MISLRRPVVAFVGALVLMALCCVLFVYPIASLGVKDRRTVLGVACPLLPLSRLCED